MTYQKGLQFSRIFHFQVNGKNQKSGKYQEKFHHRRKSAKNRGIPKSNTLFQKVYADKRVWGPCFQSNQTQQRIEQDMFGFCMP